MPSIKFDAVVETNKAISGLKDIQNAVHQTAEQVKEDGGSIDDVVNRIKNGVAAIAAGWSAKEFVQNVMQIRGQFQQLEIAFTTMLGSEEKASELMSQLMKTAAITPFDMEGIASGAKLLLAYGTEADEVTDILVHLGDIAAGLSVPLGDLVYLYGTTMVQGKMFTQDLRQFQGRGIPIATELAKQFGIAENEVADLVKSGKVGAEEFKKAVMAMSSEGGKFGGLMEAQSKSITGQISNIEDQIDQMFNEIGKSSEGAISTALTNVSKVIDHWQVIGKTILSVAAAYGTFKAAVIAGNVVLQIQKTLLAEAALQQKLAAMQGIVLSNAQAMAAAKTVLLTNAWRGLKAAMASHPIGLALAGVAGIATAIGLFSSKTDEATAMTEKYGESATKTLTRLDTLTTTVRGLTEGTSTQKKAVGELNDILKEYGVTQIKEGDNIDIINEKRAQAIELIKQEAIERQRANNLEQGEETYNTAVGNARNQLYKDLQGAQTSKLGLGVTNIIGDNEEIQQNAQAISNIIADIVDNNISLIANKTGDEYQKGIDKIYRIINVRMKAIGLSEKAIYAEWLDGGLFNHDNIVEKYISSVQKAKEAKDRNAEATDKYAKAELDAADASMTFNEKVATTERRLSNASDDVHALYKQIKTLMSQYSQNTVGFTIKFDAEIPAWMNSKSIPELQRLAKKFTAIGASLKDGQSTNINGKVYTKEQALNQGYLYASAANEKQTAADKKKQQEKEDAKKRAKEAKEAEKERKARLKAEQEGNDNLLSLQQKNADDELAIQKDSTEKKLKEIENDYKKREAEIDKQEKEFKKKNKEAGKKEDLSTEQQAAITSARSLNTQERDKKKADLAKEQQEAELASRIAFLSEYGTLEQKKVAVTEEANEKIRKINEDGTLTSTDKDYQIKSIQAGLQQSLNDLNLEDLKKNLDWDYIFSDMEKGTPEVLEHVKKQLEEFKNTAKDLTPEQIKTVTDALTELQDKMDLSTPIETIKTARSEYQKAKEAYDQYSQQYEEAKASGDTKGMDEAYKGMIAEGKKMDKANNKSKKSTEQLASTVNELGSALSGLGDQIGGTEGKVLSLAGSCVTSFGGMLSGIKAVKSATDTLSKTVAVLAIIQAAFTAINAVLSAIGGEDTSLTEYVNTMDRYIDLLSDSISDLNESMTDAKNTMSETLAIYQELKQTREDEADVIKSQSKAWLSSGAGMFSSSEGIKITNAITDTLKHGDETTNEGFQSLLDWWEKSTGETANERLRNLKGIGSTIWNWDIKDTLGRNDWIWNLSDEDLIALSKDQKVMALLGDTLSDAIKKYVDAKEALADDADALGESLLNVSWDSFYDDFVNMVEDMDNTSADFANSFAEYMRNALVKNLVASKYKGQLEKLYEAIIGSAKDGTLEDKMNDYKNQYANLAQSMQDDVKAINQVTGYTDSTSQSATAGGWETMGQETAEELNGRFTALQIAGESIANNMADTVAQMQSIVEVGISTNGAVLDIRNLMVMTNSYLEDMVKYSKLTYTDFGTKLDAVYTRLKEI